jgi:thioredoxin 1
MIRERSESTPQYSKSDRIRTATEASFTTLVLEGEGPIVVEFMSYGCAYCRALEPILQRVAEMVPPTQTIYRVNTALAADLMDSYQVTGTPTLLMFLNGTEVGRAAGPHPTVESLLEIFRSAFES